MQKRPLFIGLLGNIFDHYDTALFGFLAPFIAPLIFPEQSLVVALIKTYGLMSISIITRPLGALFFGNLGARLGTRIALSYSLTGLACITCIMGFLPTYAQIGEAAPLLLALLRISQGFFAAGETTIAPFFLLDNENPKRRGFTDSIYQSSTVMGELLASFAAVMVSTSSHPEFFWRIPFLISALTACISIYLRLRVEEKYEPKLAKVKLDLIANIFKHKGRFLRIIAVSGMSYITYSIPFVFFNSFIPHITNVTYTQMITINTSLLLFDMMAAPLFGYFADKVNHARFMSLMAGLLAICIMPLFFYLNGADMIFVSAVRIFIVMIGLGFCAPLHAWFMTQFFGPERFMLTGLAYSLGSEVFGRSAPAICLLLYNATQSPLGPALYVVMISLMASISIALPSPSPGYLITGEAKMPKY